MKYFSLNIYARHCEGEARSNLPPLTPPKEGNCSPPFLGRGWGRGSGLLRLTARNDDCEYCELFLQNFE